MDIRDLLNCDYGEFNDYNYYLADSLSPDEAVDFYSNRIKNLKNWLETDGKDQFSEKEKSYLIRAYEKMKTPLYYDYQAGMEKLISIFTLNNYDFDIGIRFPLCRLFFQVNFS